MSFKCISVDREGPVEYVTLNRPAVRNAFDDNMIRELTWWAESAAHDGTLRAVVLSGGGASFSAGADIKWMSRMIQYSQQENADDAADAARMFLVLDRLPFVVIGRVHGAALGGGAGLCAVCDLVVAADTAMFGFTEVKLGIMPAVIAPYVIGKIGRSAARELFLTGARFGADRAREIGLVHAVAPEAKLDEQVQRWLADVLSAGPEAVGSAKSLIAEVCRRAPDEAIMLTAQAIALRRVSEEGQEGLRAFLEKRKPRWFVAPSRAQSS